VCTEAVQTLGKQPNIGTKSSQKHLLIFDVMVDVTPRGINFSSAPHTSGGTKRWPLQAA
jgi:hypothetical protein